MYRIAVLTDTKDQGSRLAGWVEKTGREYGMFPRFLDFYRAFM